ncbi:hypothetical protein, partial [Legionella sp. 29fVS95]|uniref:hypothetical protein n=1 Tax=Legionella sp. 29fVS95 TaxID=3402813 RepID=UPI003AF900B0
CVFCFCAKHKRFKKQSLQVVNEHCITLQRSNGSKEQLCKRSIEFHNNILGCGSLTSWQGAPDFSVLSTQVPGVKIQ